MNGRYSSADTPQARIAIAVIAGTHEYFRQNPNGVTPGATFLTEWLEPFVELERVDAVLEVVHGVLLEEGRVRERDLLDRRAALVRTCRERVNGSRPHD